MKNLMITLTSPVHMSALTVFSVSPLEGSSSGVTLITLHRCSLLVMHAEAALCSKQEIRVKGLELNELVA